QALSAMAREAGYENLLRLLSQLLASEPVVRRSETGALAVEIAWLRAAELPKLTRIEEILAGGGATAAPSRPAAAPAPRPVAAAPTPAPRPQRAEPPAPTPAAPAPAPVRTPAPAPAAPVAAAFSRRDPVGLFKEEVSKRRQHLAGYLDAAEDIRYEDGRLVIVAPPGDMILDSRLKQEVNRQVVEEALATIWGPGTGWQLVQSNSRPGAAAPQAQAPRAAEPGAKEHPTVQTVLQIFGGEIVEDPAGFRED
ncbi:MAG TPA: hypothetical protein VL025_22215, partial [Thermoanaerobaculia bacterium]|nr:hypothetical protein [Thermoanaerobaculia bacterium]